MKITYRPLSLLSISDIYRHISSGDLIIKHISLGIIKQIEAREVSYLQLVSRESLPLVFYQGNPIFMQIYFVKSEVAAAASKQLACEPIEDMQNAWRIENNRSLANRGRRILSTPPGFSILLKKECPLYPLYLLIGVILSLK